MSRLHLRKHPGRPTRIGRHGGLLSGGGGGGGGFDVVNDLAWTILYWVEGPAFEALGLSDNDAFTTLPDEIGSNNATKSGTNSTRYQASNPDLNDRPTADFSTSQMNMPSLADQSPCTIVHIGWHPTATGNRVLDDQRDGSRLVIAPYLNGASPVWQFYNGGSAQQSYPQSAGPAAVTAKITGGNGCDMWVNGVQAYNNVHIGLAGYHGHELGNYTHIWDMGLYGVFPGTLRSDPAFADFQAWVLDHYGLAI